MNDFVVCSGLTKIYRGTTPALDHVDFCLPSGKIIGLF